jgi:hypothetical protein
MYPLVLFFIALVFASIRIKLSKDIWTVEQKIRAFLISIIFFVIGGQGVLGTIGHTYIADETARNIGWEPGSPFQFEMSMANLANAVLGLLAPLFPPAFWLATVIGNCVLFLGCAYGHWVQYQLGDVAPYNIGIYIWTADVILPLVYGPLMFYYYFKYVRRKSDHFN